MIQAVIAAGLAFLGIWFGKVRSFMLLTSSIAMSLLILPCYYAADHWPGGDDGGGFGWIFIMGGASLLSFLIVLSSAVYGAWIELGQSHKRSSKADAGDGL